MRPDDWPTLLEGYVEQARREPFEWGERDCISWACGWHKLITGRDVYAPFRGRYDNKEDATRLMLANGVRTMEEAGRFLFGPEREVLDLTQRGDIVLAANTFGLWLGARGAFPMLDGTRFLQFKHVKAGWSV